MDNAKWIISTSWGDPYGTPYETYFEGYVYEVDGDTTVDGETYAKLLCARIWWEKSIDGIVVNVINEDLNYGVVGGLKEIDQHLYFRKFENPSIDLFANWFPDTIDILLYDFSASVGDTLAGMYPLDMLPADTRYVVHEIDTIVLSDDLERRRFEVWRGTDAGYEVYYYIEGIGNDYMGLFGPYIQIFETGFYLNCYWENGIYLLGYDSCDYYEAVVDIEQPIVNNQTTIYPNPFTDELHITDYSESQKVQLSIFNYLGQEVINISSYENEEVIQTENWQIGMYILVVKQNGIAIKTQQLIKL